MVLDQLKLDIQTSLKNGDSLRVSTLRMLLSAIRYAAIKKYGADGESEMTDQDILDVIKKQAKERKESIEAYSKANRKDLAEKESNELTILQAFLPKEMTEEELESIISDIIKTGEKNFGVIMKAAVAKVQGRADGNRISTTVKKLLV